MRKIKFRLIRDNKIVGYELHEFDMNHVYIFHSRINDDSSYNITAVEGAEITCDMKEQFTGLCDKNGKEVYEGDIVTLSYGIPPTFDTLLIEYADDEYVADISVSGWWMRNIRPNGCSSSLCKTYENDIEIIGNIHENPELLKEQ